jgi:ABC-2 type transport system permease protein
MRNALTIARKELSIYFTTPWAYGVFTAMIGISSFFFLATLEQFQYVQEKAQEAGWNALGPQASMFRNLTDGVVIPLWQTSLIITLFVAPFLSMRLFAEEKRHKTFELLMTSPIRPLEIVLGKYLGGLGIISATLGLLLVYPIILSIFGSSESGTALEWSTVLLGYGGLLLWGATCMAVGMFLSALTESQALAAFLSFSILLPWMMVGNLARGTEGAWRSIIKYASFETHLGAMMTGVLELTAPLFFVSIIALFILLTHRAVEAQRWT